MVFSALIIFKGILFYYYKITGDAIYYIIAAHISRRLSLQVEGPIRQAGLRLTCLRDNYAALFMV
jgi:hypothetical protein